MDFAPKIKKAFTITEAILVVVILGVIAVLLINAIKPVEYKKDGLQTQARTMLSEIDSALTQIITNHSHHDSLDTIVELNQPGHTFSMKDANNGTKLMTLMKKYIIESNEALPSVCANLGYDSTLVFKGGGCMALKSGAVVSKTIIPGEKMISKKAKYKYGMIFLDVNGDAEPNKIEVDQYYIPLSSKGANGDDVSDCYPDTIQKNSVTYDCTTAQCSCTNDDDTCPSGKVAYTQDGITFCIKAEL